MSIEKTKDKSVFDGLCLKLKSESTYSVDKELANPVIYGEIRDVNPMVLESNITFILLN